jgi:hypothetical protein
MDAYAPAGWCRGDAADHGALAGGAYRHADDLRRQEYIVEGLRAGAKGYR